MSILSGLIITFQCESEAGLAQGTSIFCRSLLGLFIG